jgi:predicted secreted Zn-dependent protease
MRQPAHAALLAIAALACARNPAPGTDAPLPTEFVRQVRRYPVNPLNGSDLAQAIRDERKQFASNAIGMTHSGFTWSFRTAPNASGRCAVSSVRVRVESTISLPEWNAPPGTSGARLSWWRRIEGTVSQHELHHATISEESGTDLAAALLKVTAPDCRSIGPLVEAAGHAELDRMRQRQLEFDMAEGVVEIPPPPP